MTSLISLRHLRLLPALLVLILALVGAQLDAAAPIADKHVKRRVELMATQKAALTTLADMMAGRIVFDASKAKAARRTLIKSTGDIRKRFKKPRMDPNSHARPLIWQQWRDFETRAARAKDAAKGLSAHTMNGLLRTVPNMMQACLSCHETYRDTPNDFITH
ncbi:cytochrome c [Phaeobacter sp. QD34_3]|uniref:c-type cytochrome n=1 Tax=unclassified Phaeobacter TaxID=2621772 RepID=UPI00237FD2FF|nr:MULTISPECIES: cytochrome c [unclassified Phaeobacter]MDE4133457.1 cytochrome c [Phaeobacter sp. QD34_3]MDE4137093.1 cytochrome c [Phaeobacter sp. QD34_24]MDE4175303.1 cytochrome c [Phaeobacter sp. PT47_59]